MIPFMSVLCQNSKLWTNKSQQETGATETNSNCVEFQVSYSGSVLKLQPACIVVKRNTPLVSSHTLESYCNDNVRSETKHSCLCDRPTPLLLPSNVAYWNFDVFTIDRLTNGRPLIHVSVKILEMHGLVSPLKLHFMDLHTALNLIEKSYHNDNPYHTARHAADVAQAINCYILDVQKRHYVSDLEIFAMLLAALCHDADHPGLNQLYFTKKKHFLSVLYKDAAVLENHHWRVAFSIIHQSNLLRYWTDEDKRHLKYIVKKMILATDISQQGMYISKFQDSLDSNGDIDMGNAEKRLILMQMAVKCADICNPSRPWFIARCWADLAMDEFFLQGDRERNEGHSVAPNNDRLISKRPRIQIGFINFLVRPLFETWNLYMKSELSRLICHNIERSYARWCWMDENGVEDSLNFFGHMVSSDDDGDNGIGDIHVEEKELQMEREEEKVSFLSGRDTSLCLSLTEADEDPCSVVEKCSRNIDNNENNDSSSNCNGDNNNNDSKEDSNDDAHLNIMLHPIDDEKSPLEEVVTGRFSCPLPFRSCSRRCWPNFVSSCPSYALKRCSSRRNSFVCVSSRSPRFGGSNNGKNCQRSQPPTVVHGHNNILGACGRDVIASMQKLLVASRPSYPSIADAFTAATTSCSARHLHSARRGSLPANLHVNRLEGRSVVTNGSTVTVFYVNRSKLSRNLSDCFVKVPTSEHDIDLTTITATTTNNKINNIAAATSFRLLPNVTSNCESPLSNCLFSLDVQQALRNVRSYSVSLSDSNLTLFLVE